MAAEPVDPEPAPAESDRCRTRRCRTRCCRTTRSPTRASSTPASPNPSLQNPSPAESALQNPSLQNVDLTNAGFSDTSWVADQRGQHDRVVHGQSGAERPGARTASPRSCCCTRRSRRRRPTAAPQGAGAHDPAGEHPEPAVRDRPDQSRACRTRACRIRSLQNPTLALAPGESATITLRIVDPNIFDGVTYDASGAVTPAAVAQSVNTRGRRRPAQDRAAGRDAADDHDDDDAADHARRADQPHAAVGWPNRRRWSPAR